MSGMERLLEAVAGWSEHRERLKAAGSGEEAVAALLDIAAAEGIALEGAELERLRMAAGGGAADLSDAELETVSGGLNLLDPFTTMLSRLGGFKGTPPG